MQEDHLKNLYKDAFDTFEPPTSKTSWSILEDKLSKQNFRNFSWYKFNMYYALCIGVSFILASGISLHYIRNYVLNKPILATEKPIIQHSNSLPVNVEQRTIQNGFSPIPKNNEPVVSIIQSEKENTGSGKNTISISKPIPNKDPLPFAASINIHRKQNFETTEKTKYNDTTDLRKNDLLTLHPALINDTLNKKTTPIIVTRQITIPLQDTIIHTDTVITKRKRKK